MKKLVLSLALLVSFASANATSLRDVRLQLSDQPNGGGMGGSLTLTSVVVYGDGVVARFDCPAYLPVVCQPKTIAKLDAYEMDEIQNLIEEARHGRIVNEPPRAFCIVAPMTIDSYKADNANVMLLEGHMCAGFKRNTSPAAAQLVTQLRTLKAMSNPK